ncbi:E3 ubiquitin-protein ligase RNF180-like [Armigeres subalbatus]|uniref:E3 ubiquitin-protein ligase RNF180-like n=1 Tax=Armigeres subalbatus TaxID=124917 RepID=UPI002ED146CD
MQGCREEAGDREIGLFYSFKYAKYQCRNIMIIKCKKCAHILSETESGYILSVHNENAAGENEDGEICETVAENAEVFIHEDHLPEWVRAEVEESQWTKGKLKCPKCGLKVGSFDFVSGTRCKCALNSVLPSVHFIRSKVDVKS